jgi:membrane-bound PQQ-dependent dehydrogenase (glucose/quinate/shikimate family)
MISRRWFVGCACLVFAAVMTTGRAVERPIDGWPVYGHDGGGMRYSPLTDITRQNVGRLAVAWTFHTGDISDGGGNRPRSGFETTPIVVDDTLYFTTATNRIIALDPETGRQRWTFDPTIETRGNYGDGLVSRGVATWLDPTVRQGEPCRRRVYEATLDARLIAVDAATGKPCERFGRSGQVSLTDVPRYRAGVYHMTSPPAVVDDVIVVGSAINDNERVDAPSGAVRAFDARSGALRWTWDPIPPNLDNGGSSATWRTGAANAWSMLSVDRVRHLVFVPTGSASPDYYGGLRPGDNRWANSVVALHAATGELAWGFQLVHHDLWDYDSASAPLLATLTRDGRPVPVVVQGNKTGFLYVLNRENGVPVFPVVERRAPPSDVPGETAWPTQPVPALLPAVTPQRMAADDAWGPTAEDRAACRRLMTGLRNDGVFTPPSVQGTLVYPGNLGGINWSGYAYDPSHQLLIVNTNNLPAKVQLITRDRPNDPQRTREDGEYAQQAGSPYLMFRRFLQSPSHLPCTSPPWGTLAAVDLAQGRVRWQVPLGSMRDFGGAHPAVPPGSLTLGGPIVTASGLIFIAGTLDASLHAVDVETGKELWTGALPASGHATPMTYKLSASGKQYVVIAAGGHAKISEERLGDTLVAFALSP